MFKNLAKELREFILRGNVLDMAVGIIIGASFKSIVDSMVNDIIIGNKKVCGILAEAGIDAQAPRLEYIVLGIGINVKRTAFPQELSEIAGSIEDFSDKTVSKKQLIAEILKNLSPLLAGEIPSDTMDRYRSRSLFLGRSVFTLSEPSVSGVAVEIDDGGALIIRSSDGALHKIAAGEVSVRSL